MRKYGFEHTADLTEMLKFMGSTDVELTKTLQCLHENRVIREVKCRKLVMDCNLSELRRLWLQYK